MAYKLRYSDYPGTDTGPPDPERWVGPPGPPGPSGPMPPGGPFLPLSGGTVTGSVNVGANTSGSGGTPTTLPPLQVQVLTNGTPQIADPVIVQTTYFTDTPFYIAPIKTNWTVLYLVNNGNNTGLTIDSMGGSAHINGRASGSPGQVAPIAPVLVDGILFSLRAYGASATAFSSQERARINFCAAENYTDASQGGYLAFLTSPIGTANTVAAVEVARLSAAGNLMLGSITDNTARLQVTGAARLTGGLGAFGAVAPIAKPTVTGAKGGNAALASLMTALAAYGLVVDSTTA